MLTGHKLSFATALRLLPLFFGSADLVVHHVFALQRLCFFDNAGMVWVRATVFRPVDSNIKGSTWSHARSRSPTSGAHTRQVESICKENGALSFERATDEKERDALWAARRGAYYAAAKSRNAGPDKKMKVRVRAMSGKRARGDMLFLPDQAFVMSFVLAWA